MSVSRVFGSRNRKTGGSRRRGWRGLERQSGCCVEGKVAYIGRSGRKWMVELHERRKAVLDGSLALMLVEFVESFALAFL